jgi:hypothetical protein
MLVIPFFISKSAQNKFVVFFSGKSVGKTSKINLFKQLYCNFLQSQFNPNIFYFRISFIQSNVGFFKGLRLKFETRALEQFIYHYNKR